MSIIKNIALDYHIESNGGLPENSKNLWSELNLGDLLGESCEEYHIPVVNTTTKTSYDSVLQKHKKKCKKPAYNAVIERYENKPSMPKVITRNTLSRLSDPIKQRGGSRPSSKLDSRANSSVLTNTKSFVNANERFVHRR